MAKDSAGIRYQRVGCTRPPSISRNAEEPCHSPVALISRDAQMFWKLVGIFWTHLLREGRRHRLDINPTTPKLHMGIKIERGTMGRVTFGHLLTEQKLESPL